MKEEGEDVAYQALYRTYRPQSFNEVVGQEHIKRTLQNAIKYNKVAHAYLFSGPRGTGKTTFAKIFAKAVNCLNPDIHDACNECPNCIEINKGTSEACIEMDAASNNGVDDVREIRDKVKFLPPNGKYKVYIIDEVHMLSNSAFNALLKTLEEPPKHVIFILATTEPYKVPATILSRCQRFDFRSLSTEDIESRLKEVIQSEKIDISDEAISLIARTADGGMRDALSLLDQAISYGGEHITVSDVHMVNGSLSDEILIQLVASSINKENVKSLEIIDQLISSGKEIPRIIDDLVQFYLHILLFKNVKDFKPSLLYSNPDFIELSKKIGNKRLYFYLDILNETMNNIKQTNQKRAFLEMALIKMGDDVELQTVMEYEKIKNLEERVKQLEMNKVTPVFEKPVLKEKIEISGNQVERVLNNGNKEKKEMYLKQWGELFKTSDPRKKAMGDMMLCSNLVAMNDNEMIIVFEDDSLSQIANKDANKKVILSLLNNNSLEVKDFLALSKKVWLEVMTEFKRQYQAGIKKPVLGNINLGVRSEIKPQKIIKEKTITDEAIEMFGSDLVKEK